MSNQYESLLVASHRFQKRFQVVHQLLNDVRSRLHAQDVEPFIALNVSSAHPANSAEYFRDYCEHALRWIIEHSTSEVTAISVINLVTIYWNDKKKFTELSRQELTLFLEVLYVCQKHLKSEAFLGDELKACYAYRLYIDRRFDEAIEIQRGVVSTRKRALGANNIATAESAFLLANIFKQKGFIEQAIHYYSIAMLGFESNLGSRSEKTKLCMTKT
ncbi:MAG: tetratricopeptide repeat protein, partial [Pseudomonadota bacterium]